jgi:hypothetical protein
MAILLGVYPVALCCPAALYRALSRMKKSRDVLAALAAAAAAKPEDAAGAMPFCRMWAICLAAVTRVIGQIHMCGAEDSGRHWWIGDGCTDGPLACRQGMRISVLGSVAAERKAAVATGKKRLQLACVCWWAACMLADQTPGHLPPFGPGSLLLGLARRGGAHGTTLAASAEHVAAAAAAGSDAEKLMQQGITQLMLKVGCCLRRSYFRSCHAACMRCR